MAEFMAELMAVFMDKSGTRFMIKMVIGPLEMTTFD